jgi:hypothetical protein
MRGEGKESLDNLPFKDPKKKSIVSRELANHCQ